MQINPEVMVGKKFAKWTVLVQVPHKKDRHTRYLCECSCGRAKEVTKHALQSGKSSRCRSCIMKETLTTHGKYGTPAYISWYNMLSRCRNPKATKYPDYGARGIRVCERWFKFE